MTSFVRRDRASERAQEGSRRGGKERGGGNQPGGRLRRAVLAQRRAQRSRWLLIWIFDAARETALHRDSESRFSLCLTFSPLLIFLSFFCNGNISALFRFV